MRIVVAGGSGFLGRALVDGARRDGHEVQVLTRRPRAAGEVAWDPASGAAGGWAEALEQADAVVNLAGAGIADKPWTDARKAAILDSRVASTRALAGAIRACARPPRTFVSASAVGYYGTAGDVPLTEDAPAGADFLASVCQAWEREAGAAAASARTVLLRTGVVLAAHGGALPQMAAPFRFFVGGRIGSGRQYVSWIHLDDWVGMVRWAIEGGVSGPLNVTAPAPVTNAAFARSIAAAMRRPALVPAPAFAVRAVLGREMADALVLGGQRVLPAKAGALGFTFRHTSADAALAAIYG